MMPLARQIIERLSLRGSRGRGGSPTTQERESIEALRLRLRALPPPAPNPSPAAQAWNANIQTLVQCVENDDPRAFLRWPVIQKSMFVTSRHTARRELAEMKKLADWTARWSNAIVESPVGCPERFPSCRRSSTNLIHHAYHLAQFEGRTGIPVHEFRTVFEFGGGYGSLCRLFYNLGFRGSYVIFDSPAFSALQEYFLKGVGLGVAAYPGEGRICCLSDLDGVRRTLAERLPAPAPGALFIATWSLSETPPEVRRTILPALSDFDAFLIAYQARFAEVNNLEYFAELKESLPEVEWTHWEIDHLPDNYYLIGRRPPSRH
jgi:hypothetical protein